MSNTMESAVLTASIKNLKVLQNMQKKQEDLIAVVSDIAQGQRAQDEVLEEIRTKPEPDILSDIKSVVTDLSKAFHAIDLDQLEQSIQTHTHKTIEKSEQAIVQSIDASKDTLINTSDKHMHKTIDVVHKENKHLSEKVGALTHTVNDAHKEEMDVLTEIKQSGQIETLRKLIVGLKAQRNNLEKLANYVELLSENVNESRKDVSMRVQALVEGVQDSNARTKSMDLRLSALSGEESDDSDDIAQSLELLTGIEYKNEETTPLPTPEFDRADFDKDDQLNEIDELIQDLDEE